MKTKTEERVEKMRNGGEIKCPRCNDGFISAVGDAKTTNVFKCSHCPTGITLTVPMERNV
jgi:DNA-directed RNA polymerase subunit RPC12/RpoP